MVEVLWRIIDRKPEYLEKHFLAPPKASEVVKAVDTLVKLDIAILKAAQIPVWGPPGHR
jgi:hypothetical protein